MEKVMVAMSGGVDSSVAVFLLLQQGFSVEGATLWLSGSSQDFKDAADSAKRFKIDWELLDERELFMKKVINPFVESYRLGQTPNPCVFCNPNVKFERLLSHMLDRRASFLATGHYAKIAYSSESGRYQILKAADTTKDQSYMLYGLSQKQLAHIKFPLGEYTKNDIRLIAYSQGLENAQKKDSQDICFIPDGDYRSFLKYNTGDLGKEGNFITKSGNVLGKHKGLCCYTIGQRKGLGLSSSEPWYVVEKREDGDVLLGRENELYKSRFYIKDCNWVSIKEPTEPTQLLIKTRYRQKEMPAILYPKEDKCSVVELSSHGKAIAPGQAAVFYDGDILLGGGVITSEEV